MRYPYWLLTKLYCLRLIHQALKLYRWSFTPWEYPYEEGNAKLRWLRAGTFLNFHMCLGLFIGGVLSGKPLRMLSGTVSVSMAIFSMWLVRHTGRVVEDRLRMERELQRRKIAALKP